MNMAGVPLDTQDRVLRAGGDMLGTEDTNAVEDSLDAMLQVLCENGFELIHRSERGESF